MVALLLKTPNIDVNQKNDGGSSTLHLTVFRKNYEALGMLLKVPNIDANTVDNHGQSALHYAMDQNDIEALKLLLSVPNIDVNILNNNGWSAVSMAVNDNNMEVSKLMLSHPGLTALTLNHKDNYGAAPVMWAVVKKQVELLEVLVADMRVNLDTTDLEGRGLEEVARWPFQHSQQYNIIYFNAI